MRDPSYCCFAASQSACRAHSASVGKSPTKWEKQLVQSETEFLILDPSLFARAFTARQV
jgi:hypothetical protein